MRKQLLFTAVVSLFVACSQDAIDEKHETQTSMVNIPEKIYAEIDNVTSRTYVEEGNHLRWNEGDKISYFPGITYNLEYRFDGKTGDNSGSFTKITEKLITGNELENTYAFYPYNEATSMSDEGIINFTFPATQSYAENSFGLGANAMVAVTDGKDDNILRFKNLCGYIKLKVYGDATIKSLTLKGNDDEPLAGAATITAIYGNDPVTTLADDATTTLIIDCGTGVTLGTTAEEATEFWFVVPSQSFAKGISIDITDINGLVMTQSTTKEVVIDRNTIQPMTVFEFKPQSSYKPTNNEILYTSTSKIEPYATDVFGANIISNEWDETTGEGIITFDGDVYYLGEYAFCNLDNLTNITTPNSIMTIGYCAFYGCENLTTITIPSELKVIGDSAFSGCSKLTNITIPKSVTTIGDSAFYGCSIATITIPNSFISIGSYAFSGCKGTLCIDNSNNMNVTCYVDSFSHELAYSGIFINSKFSEIIFGDNVSIIPQNAFRECSYLKKITFGNNIKYIEDNAFYGCSALTAVSLPDSIVSIGNGAFNGCSKMTDIYIPNSIMSIGNDAFYKCDNLSNVHIDDIAKWCEIKFNSSDSNPLYYADNLYVNGQLIEGSVTLDKISAIGQYAFYEYDHISSITLPDSVTQIGAYAFNGCDNLCNINLGNGLKFIYEYAFRDCSNLTDIHLCDGIIMINDYAFSRCSSLTNISIPNSITTIGEGAFSNCSSLSEVFCKATTPPSIGSIAFSYNASGRKIYVPASDDDSIINAYKSAWSGFKSSIYEYEF